MKKKFAFLMCLAMGRLVYGQQAPLFTEPAQSAESAQPLEIPQKQTTVDPLRVEWKSLKKEIKGGKFFQAIYGAIKFFKKIADQHQLQLEKQAKEIIVLQNNYDVLKNENESLKRAHDALQKKHDDSVTRSDAMYKSLQQIFVANNQYSGG